MIIFFEEDDLVSFGNYMISEERKESYKNYVGVDSSKVLPVDIQNWAQFRQEKIEKSRETNKDYN